MPTNTVMVRGLVTLLHGPEPREFLYRAGYALYNDRATRHLLVDQGSWIQAAEAAPEHWVQCVWVRAAWQRLRTHVPTSVRGLCGSWTLASVDWAQKTAWRSRRRCKRTTASRALTFTYVCRARSDSKVLTSLVQLNFFGFAGVRALVTSLQHNESLTILDFSVGLRLPR